MKARIVTIGDEILIGQIIDTNSAWLAEQLSALNIQVNEIASISDTREAIQTQLDAWVGKVDLVIFTGGLGPTQDDITKQALGDWFGGGWRSDERVLERVQAHFAERGIAMPEVNREQADVPGSCEVLHNAHGSAPGMWFKKEGTIAISMPGVPFEMKSIFTDEVMPRLKSNTGHHAVVHRTVHTQGIGESSLMEIIGDWEEEMRAKGLKLAYLPSVGSVRLRLTGTGKDEQSVREQVDLYVAKLLPLISEYAFGFDGARLEAIIGSLLINSKRSVTTAESCTGGYIAHLITTIPGSSAYFKGGTVAYANDVKVKVLGVSPQDIIEHGAVSEAVAIQMAESAKEQFQTDYALATTGIAGPDGGTEEKPVGTVWIAIAGPSRSYALCFRMGNARERNIRKSALQALQLLRKEILKDEGISYQMALS